MKTVAIMQPTFLPWIGYFGLIDTVDEFVILDHVQFDKRSWQQRNRIKTANGDVWLTVPVVSKNLSRQSIQDVKIDSENRDFPRKLISTIEHSYKKAPFYDQYALVITDLLEKNHTYLRDLNVAVIKHICDIMGMDVVFRFSSDMKVSGKKSSLLVDICEQIEGDHYISSPGSREYIQDSDDFEKSGIDVTYFNYEHPAYDQLYGDFVPYMSIIDLLFNMGDESIDIIRKGINDEVFVHHTGT